MNRWILLVVAAAACLSSARLQGAVISRDWKTAGDGLLTYDDVNRREWLDLTESQLSQFPGANREAKFQYVKSQTASGGLFDGFTVAISTDVTSLAQSASVDVSTSSYPTNAVPVGALIDLIGATLDVSPTRRYAAGLLDEVAGTPSSRLGFIFHVDPDNGRFGSAGLSLSANHDVLFSPLPGVMLYRTVPETFSIGSVATVLALGFRAFAGRTGCEPGRRVGRGRSRPRRGGD